jgi:type I restriction enzyme, S subunit
VSWKKAVLDDVAEFSLGKMLDQKKNRGELFPYLANLNVRWGEFDLSDLRAMRFESHELDRFGLKFGDIVMCEGGEPGRCAIWKSHKPGMMIQKALHRIRPRDGLNNQFLYYSFLHKGKAGHFAPLFTGSTIKHLPKQNLAKVEIDIPPVAVQEYIASTLSAYDDLIENNRRRIALLEEAARQLYKEWFVRFRFPGHEHVKIVEGMPQGWKKVKVADILKRYPPGKLYSQKTASEKGKVPILDQGQSGLVGFHDDPPSFTASLDDPVIVLANHTCYQRVIHYPFSAIQNVLPYKSSDEYPRNIYWLHHATDGLVTLNAYKGHWPEFIAKEVVVPPEHICAEFGEFARCDHQQIYWLEKHNRKLTQARDLLLPKLMSGEIAV